MIAEDIRLFNAAVPGSLPLCLEALGIQHFQALARQLRDPQVSAMAGLPDLSREAVAARWLDAQREAGDRNFAIMHAAWGLVGLVGYNRCGSSAMLQFCIGQDFQGRGISAPAAILALARARDEHVGTVFAVSHRGNLRSHRTLARVGFTRMTLPARLPPDDAMEFFVLNEASEVDGARDRLPLEKLCRAVGSPLRYCMAGCARDRVDARGSVVEKRASSTIRSE